MMMLSLQFSSFSYHRCLRSSRYASQHPRVKHFHVLSWILKTYIHLYCQSQNFLICMN